MKTLLERIADMAACIGGNAEEVLLDAAKEIETLRAKIERMERQEPGFRERCTPSAPTGCSNRFPLYTLPGAQPAPSVPEGWLRAVDEALIVTHLGVTNESDTYEQAREKLNNLIGWHVDVATDPAVNGGWKFVPIEPTREMLEAGQTEWLDSAGADPSFDVYRAMLAAAPEAKP